MRPSQARDSAAVFNDRAGEYRRWLSLQRLALAKAEREEREREEELERKALARAKGLKKAEQLKRQKEAQKREAQEEPEDEGDIFGGLFDAVDEQKNHLKRKWAPATP